MPLVRTGTPYAVGPGSVTKPDGSPYAVFTPFSRAWSAHGWPAPAGGPPPGLRWARSVQGEDLPADLPRPRVVTFAQSFHWMDRPRVATTVRGMLVPNGVLVHVGAVTHQGVDGDDDLVPSLTVIEYGETTPFELCPALPDTLAPGASVDGCSIVLVPDGVEVERISYLADVSEDFEYWTVP